MNVTAGEFKESLEQFLDMAETAPVFVEKSEGKKSVLISYSMYEHFRVLEDRYWAERATQAESEGYLGYNDSEAILAGLNEASDV